MFVNDQRVEGGDQSTLSLPGDQDRLIEAVAKANPGTVVVLNTGGPVLMPWLDNVAGVVEAWYPGQESGNAITSVLFGDVDPSGRLPITFPRSDRQTPVSDPQRWPGRNQIARYDEALEVGYRWYDAQGETPLFPFGFGLSYTKFDYGELKVIHRKSNGDDMVDLAVDVTNSGTKAGAEVVQLYLGDPPAAALHSFKAWTQRARTEPARILSYGTNTLQIGSFSPVIDFFTRSSRWAGRSERQFTQVS